jgi:hypothetical protein
MHIYYQNQRSLLKNLYIQETRNLKAIINQPELLMNFYTLVYLIKK